jgi:hypothetical protein
MTSVTKRASSGDHRASDDGNAGGSIDGTADSRADGRDGGIVGAIPYLAVLVCAVVGIYICWRQGSAGGGQGAVVGGAALLAGAVIRLVVPARLAGLLGTRKRATDVLTLTIFGVSLLIAGLVLPGYGQAG